MKRNLGQRLPFSQNLIYLYIYLCFKEGPSAFNIVTLVLPFVLLWLVPRNL